MCSMQTTIYSDHQNTDAQHQTVFLEMAASDILYRQLKQGHLLCHISAMDWSLSAHRMANGPCHPGNDDADITKRSAYGHCRTG